MESECIHAPTVESCPMCQLRHRAFPLRFGLLLLVATLIRGVVARHSTPARSMPVTVGTAPMTISRWAGQQLLTQEAHVETACRAQVSRTL